VLKQGPDSFGSKVVIIDPKNAELSQCAHVVSPDINNNVEKVLEAVKNFNRTRIIRQQIINKEGKKRGKAAKWFDIGMKPCILFVDEWVALQGLFPKKAPRENPDYCLAAFQSLIQQIATQGASAGCFLIISIAQASVGVGGLDTVVKNSCGIRIMFKPEKEEARFIWDRMQLEVLREWSFGPGDAWISIDDGTNNNIRFVKFPLLDARFDEYRALSDLLEEYYK
jgi:DNA segregation ATPase FtsK/SpoIIIE-like protein